MKHLLFAAAEQEEIECAQHAWSVCRQRLEGKIEADFMLTGIGTTSTCYRLTRQILQAQYTGKPYDLIIDIGIAGSYDMERFPMGSAAVIDAEYFGDLGFETLSGFQTLFQYELLEADAYPFKGGAVRRSRLPFPRLEQRLRTYLPAKGVTVQTVSGDPVKVQDIYQRFLPDIESMEGAAVYYVAALEHLPFFEIRTVSNAVGERNRSRWDIPAALRRLDRCCREILESLLEDLNGTAAGTPEKKETFTLAFSPCPNDTFAFHAMIHHLVDTEGLEFKVTLADVEQLNQSALQDRYDISKLSYHGFFDVAGKYVMLESGSALGFHNGPLLVKKKGSDFRPDGLIAIPGTHTTAALLLKTAYPQCTRLQPMLFSDIESAVLEGKADAGVLIHEGRFTYQDKGLELVTDLGEYWQENFGHAIPLGGIAVRRSLPQETALKINRVLRRSIEFAYAHPEKSADFIMENAQELTREVQRKHIGLFVNNYTIDLGKEGKAAVEFLYSKYAQDKKGPRPEHLFIR